MHKSPLANNQYSADNSPSCHSTMLVTVTISIQRNVQILAAIPLIAVETRRRRRPCHHCRVSAAPWRHNFVSDSWQDELCVVSTTAATRMSPPPAKGAKEMLPWRVDVTIIGWIHEAIVGATVMPTIGSPCVFTVLPTARRMGGTDQRTCW